jgi:glyoxylase-like metal-dependent hydrolase (beta-lactamase superfamily II)
VPEDAIVAALAQALGLRPACLVDIARRRWMPEPIELKRWGSVAEFRSLYGRYEVKNYLVWDRDTKEAALFDTGMATEAPLKTIAAEKLALTSIFLTHTHADHVGALEMLRRQFHPRVFVGAREPLAGAQAVKEGDLFKLGRFNIYARETDGHSVGGITYVVGGFPIGLPSLAIVGDALFAGSVGGANISYERLLTNVRGKILTLPDSTVLCPGHGPLTTVAQEKAHNPFCA